MPDRNPELRDVAFYYSLANIGLEMVAPAGIGYALDSYFGCLPWVTIMGAVFGLIAGMTHLLVLLKRHDEAESARRNNGPR